MADLLAHHPSDGSQDTRDPDDGAPGDRDSRDDPPERHADGTDSVDADPVLVRSRRSVLLLLGAGVLAPVVMARTGRSQQVRTQVGNLAVGVLGTSRRTRATAGAHHGAAATSWPDVVRVHLDVRNLGGSALLLSPGQFRLRLHGGVSVMPSAWLHEPTALHAGQTRTTWVDYRAPADGDLHLEFTPAGRSVPVTHALPHAARGHQ